MSELVKRLTTVGAVFTLALAIPLTSLAAAKNETKGSEKVIVDKSYGSKTKPSEVRQETHPSGRKDTYYGNQRSADGRVDKPHGHTVQSPDGKIQYARTPEGRVLKDAKVSVPTQSPKQGSKTGSNSKK
jgi:hypothetical protein